jgi:hypothetical protein
MPRRRNRKLVNPEQNLDSFLDVLTNTIGVLMFVSLFIALISVEASTKIRTPLVSKSNKVPYFFEIRGNRISYLDNNKVNDQIIFARSALPSCDTPDMSPSSDIYLNEVYRDRVEEYKNCVNQATAKLKKFEAQTKHYTVKFIDANAVVYKPKSANVGESISELTKDDSEFQTIVSNLNPQTDYLAFIVRPDSFPAFRAARQQAWKRGFDVGWEPQLEKNPIAIDLFGSGGRQVGVQ